MAKRTDRLKPILHNIGQLESLKTLDPIATPADLKPLSDALIDVAIDALTEVARLEEGHKANNDRLQELAASVNVLIK